MCDKTFSVYRTRTIRVRQGHPLFGYFDHISRCSNNLQNAVRFRQRQVFTGLQKDAADLTSNEKEILDEIRTAGERMEGFVLPEAGSPFMSYEFMERLMRVTDNPDFFAYGFPKQTAQWVIRQAVSDMRAFITSLKKWGSDPSGFTGKPELPGYARKGGHSSYRFTNQDAVLHEASDGTYYMKLPLTKTRLLCGPVIPHARLKEVKVTPDNGSYVLGIVFEKTGTDIRPVETSDRIASVDIGVNNLMAVTNNCGLPCLLYKGGIIKSANHYYNKKLAKIVSEQTKSTGRKFRPTKESMRLTIRRNDRVLDCLHKTAKHLIGWCVENRIDTIVVGVNKGFKDKVNIGRVNNQNFVQIPFFRLRQILSYLAAENGIRYLEHEESYTSKASFPDMDALPVYGDDNCIHHTFSGRRGPARYKNMVRANGFHGLYKTSDGTVINADLNGSANILRKAFPDAFKDGHVLPDFCNVSVIVHPDKEKTDALRNRQKEHAGIDGISRAKEKRLRRNGAAA